MRYDFYITGPIGEEYDWWTGQRGTMPDEVRSFLDSHKDEEVHIGVCSPGGYTSAGLEIYQLISDHGNVHIHILGMTASAATLLCMGAKHIEMSPGSLMLIHNCSMEIMEWRSANKHDLDDIISAFRHDRDDLDTIDKVIASLYAVRSGHTLEECMECMDRAEWLSPDEALEFGLIDGITSTESATEGAPQPVLAAGFHNLYTNTIMKEYGLPPLPQCGVHPTKSFVQKAVDAVRSVFRNEPALNDYEMTNDYERLAALLDMSDGIPVNSDGAVTFSPEQLQAIESRMAALELDVESARLERDASDQSLADLRGQLADANATIENLKGAPGAATSKKVEDDEPDGADPVSSAREMFNRIKDL